MLGTRLSNRYEITAEIGRGGMGVVYQARDPRLDREVAIKLIPPLRVGSGNEERFQREARVVAQMDHPAIVPIHDYGRHDGALFFVMPLLEGTTLRQLIRDDRLQLENTVEVGIQVAEALDHSHSQGVLHRDVKPENIMVTKERGNLRVRVMDFGLAHDLGESRITLTEGLMVGTPAYLSPEQILGKHLDPRSDIYALGIVLYECLAGEVPFTGALHTTIERIRNEPALSLSERGLSLDGELERIVLCCLAKRPSDRPASGGELAAALASYRRKLRDGNRSGVVAVRGRQRRRVLATPGTPLVGRDSELEILLGSLERAQDGHCQLVLVAGEAGTGKTRLLEELEARVQKRPVRILHGLFAESEGASPYQGLCDLILDHFRNPDVGPTPDLTDLAGELLPLFPVLSEIESLRRDVLESSPSPSDGTAVKPMNDGPAPSGSTRVFELLASTLSRLLDGRHALLLLENLHRGEISIEALAYIVRRLAPTPTLIVGSYRPSEVDRGHPFERFLDTFRDDPGCRSLHLKPLDRDSFRLLLAALMGSSALREDLVDSLFEATEGNPFFTQELVRTLNESGEIHRDESGGFVLAGEPELPSRALPATMQQAIEKRIERLPVGQQRLLATASVLGKQFEFRDLLDLALSSRSIAPRGGHYPSTEEELEDGVDALVRQGLLVEDFKTRGDHLSFASGIVRNVLYSEIPRRRRRGLHRRLAEQLEARHADRLERVHARLVHHFYEGDVPEKTVLYALALAHNLLETWSPEDAIRACKKALEFAEEGEVEDSNRLQGELHFLVARAHDALGQSSSALLRAEKSVHAYGQTEAQSEAAEVALFAARVAWQNRQMQETRRWVDRGAKLARQSSAREPLRQLLILSATVANLRGDPAAADEYHREAQALTRSMEPTEELPQGGRLVSVLPALISSLDPGVVHSDWEVEVVATLFDTLLTCDADGHLTPSLCTSWEASEDACSFEFTLRSEVAFADGHTLSAKDVKIALERAARCRGKNPAAALFEIVGADEYIQGEVQELRGIEVLSADRLRFYLRQPLPIFPALLTDYGTAIVRSTDSGLVGTGPFRLKSPQPADGRVRLERNERSWRPSPSLQTIDLRTDLDPAGVAMGLRQGSIDLARDLPPEVLEEVLRDPRFQSGFVESTRKSVCFALWNTGGPMSRHPEVRQALSSIPVRELVWRTLGRCAQPAVGLIPPGLLGHDPGRRPAVLTPEELQSILRSSPVEFPISLRAAVLPLLADRHSALISSLFRRWRELGVEVLNLTPTMDSFVDHIENNEGIDLFLGRWNADYEDPDNFTYHLFHSKDGLLRRWFSSLASDQLLARARRETTPESRQNLYHQFEDLLAHEHIFLPLFHDIDYRIAAPTVRHVQLGSSPPYVDYTRLAKAPSEPVVERDHHARLTGELHVPVVGRLNSLDPLRTAVLEYAEVIPNLFETLTVIGNEARIVPRLARSFEALDGGHRYRFSLRPQILFHDGRRLSVRDVRYSFERALGQPSKDLPRLPIRGALDLSLGKATELAGFSVLSETEFLIELEEPLAFFPALLTHPAFAVVPEGSELFDGRWRDGCVGTGPFRVVGFEPGERLDLERNPHYWRAGLPKSGRLVFHFGIAPERIPAELKAGHLTLASDLRPADLEDLRKDPDFAGGWHEAPRLSTYFLALNTRRGPFRDSGLRRAFAASIDLRQILAEPGLGRMAVPAHGLLPPGLLGYESPSATPPPPLDATEILRGVRLEAALNPAYAGVYAPLWESLQHTFERLGIRLEVSHGSATDMITRAHAGDLDFKAQRWIADYPDSDSFMMGLLHSEHGVLGRLCGSEDIDLRLEQARRENDPALRHAIYRELEEHLAREALLVPLFHEQTYRIAHPHTRGLRVGLSMPEVRYEELWTKE